MKGIDVVSELCMAVFRIPLVRSFVPTFGHGWTSTVGTALRSSCCGDICTWGACRGTQGIGDKITACGKAISPVPLLANGIGLSTVGFGV